jgi:hypothetical protein
MHGSHSHYARQGPVFYRFRTRASRDAWVRAGPAAARGDRRVAVSSAEVPQRLKFGRVDPEFKLELREGPELESG